MKQLTDEELERAAREFRRGIKPSIIAASLGMTEAQMTEALTDFATRKKEAMKQPPFEHPKKEESKREVIVGFEIERNAPSIRETTPLGYIARLVQQLNVGDVVHGLRGGTRCSIGRALRERGLRYVSRSYQDGEKTLWRLQVISKH